MLAVALLNSEAPAKRSQHANATYRNIVGRNMLLAFVDASSKMVKLEPTTLNTSQQGGQNARNMLRPTMLRWHVANVWPGLNERVDDHLTMKLNVLTIHFRLVG